MQPWPSCKHRRRNSRWAIKRLNKLSEVYDACVLYPAPLRDTLISLAVTRLFQAHWTDAIHDEWISNLLQARPNIAPEQLARTRGVMNLAVPGAAVTGYEKLIDSLSLPDKNDRHVLAAAIYCKARQIVTFNTRDFPSVVLSAHGVETCHPDRFIVQLLAQHPAQVLDALKQQRLRLLRPEVSVEDFLETLARQGLPKTVVYLRLHTASL